MISPEVVIGDKASNPAAFVVAPVPPLAILIVVPLQTPEVIVPTLVKLDVTTLLAKVVPVNVFASAAIVMSALPSNATPLMFLVAANLVAVLALPVSVPVNPVDVTDVNPATEVTVPPKVIVVLPNVVVLFANCAFVMPAFEARFAVVNPVAEMTPALIEIPEPAVNPSCTPKPVMSAFVIFNLENAIAAPEATSALEMLELVANVPKPKFVLAAAGVVAPVPPLAISIVDALQVPEVIVPTVAKLARDVKVVLEVAVMFPAVVAVVAFPKKLVAVTSLLKVFAPANVCAPVEIKPGFDASAAANIILVPLIVPPAA